MTERKREKERERERNRDRERERRSEKERDIKKGKNIGSAKNVITQFETAIKYNGESRTLFAHYPTENNTLLVTQKL